MLVNFQTFLFQLHLVHWNSSKYQTPLEAVSQADGLAVMGIFMEVSTLGIWITGYTCVQMVESCPITKWSGIQIPFEYWTKFSPVFKIWSECHTTIWIPDKQKYISQMSLFWYSYSDPNYSTKTFSLYISLNLVLRGSALLKSFRNRSCLFLTAKCVSLTLQPSFKFSAFFLLKGQSLIT